MGIVVYPQASVASTSQVAAVLTTSGVHSITIPSSMVVGVETQYPIVQGTWATSGINLPAGYSILGSSTPQTSISLGAINSATTWTASTLPSSSNWISVTYGNGMFVAVAYGSTAAAYSTNGSTWTASTLPSSSTWYSVTYGNGMFVAVAYGSTAAAYSNSVFPTVVVLTPLTGVTY